ncbi:MAG TPA: AarF/UbiB family protein [Bacteroidales bacterium]|jgi:hypothetical protein|nr:AarF/UbiB family protein [Bacteroidales bacterium]
MKSDTYTLTIFLVSRWIGENGLSEKTRIFFERSGFEIIFDKRNDIFSAFEELKIIDEEYYDWFIALDLIPWKNYKSELKNIDWDSDSDNHRIEWSIYVVKKFLKEQAFYCNKISKTSFPSVPFKYYSKSKRITLLFQRYYKDIDNQINNKHNAFATKFKIIRPLTNFGCNNKTDLIDLNGHKFVCKTFKPDRITYLENEIIAREELNSIIFIPPIITTGTNFILIEYLEDSKSLTSAYNKYKLLKLSFAKKIFLDLKVIYSKGFIHLDFHPGNILVDSKLNLVYIDFEYLHRHYYEFKLQKSPGLIKHNKLTYNSPLEHITYKNYWYNIIRIPLYHLLYLPIGLLYVERLYTIITIIIKEKKMKILRRLRKLSKLL